LSAGFRARISYRISYHIVSASLHMIEVSGLRDWQATESSLGLDVVSCRRHKLVPTSTQPPTTSNIRYDRWFALENWQASCQFNLAHELKEN